MRRSSSSGCRRSPIFGEVTLNDAVDLSYFVRDRGVPQVLDFPFQQLSALRDAYPELSTSASDVRLAQESVLVVSRIDFATGREVVTAFNNADTPAHVTVTSATPGARSVAFGAGSAQGGAGTSLALTIPAVSAVVAVPAGAVPQTAPAKPSVSGHDDDLTSLPPRHDRAGHGSRERLLRDPTAGRELAARRDRRLGAVPGLPRAGSFQAARAGRGRRRRTRSDRGDIELVRCHRPAERVASAARSATNPNLRSDLLRQHP